MKEIELGAAKIPLEGAWPVHIFNLTLMWGWAAGYWILSTCPVAGPALTGNDLSEVASKCAPIALITVLWGILYINMHGPLALWRLLLLFQLVKTEDVTPQFEAVSRRFFENTLEQAPVFLTSMWVYTLFVDYATAKPLGFLYLAARSTYPICYAARGEFSWPVELATQPGYMTQGIFILGVLVTCGWGGDWKDCVNNHLIGTTLKAYSLGFFTLLPGLPLGPIYLYIHYHCHQKWKRKQD